MAAIADLLAHHLEQALVERQAAEQAERGAGLALEQARLAARDGAERRHRLVVALDEAKSVEDAAGQALGEVRGRHADALRETERLADAAAAGSDPAIRGLAKHADSADMLRQLAAAHERRIAARAAEREQAEQALAKHDAVEAQRIAEQLEALMQAEADLVDRRLEEAIARASAVFALVDQRRQAQPREPWPIGLTQAGERFDAIVAGFQVASWRINPGRTALGSITARPFRAAVTTACDCWGQGAELSRREPDQAA